MTILLRFLMLIVGLSLALCGFLLWCRGVIPGWSAILGGFFGLDVVESAVSGRSFGGVSVEME